MIVKEWEANAYICPIISFQHKNSITAEHCRGKTCMAWREVTKNHGCCGMTNMGAGHTTKEYKQIETLQANEDNV